MGRLIDADAFIEDIKTEIVNLALDGLKGTPRPREELYQIIERINEQPTAYDLENVIEELKQADICPNCSMYCADANMCGHDEMRKQAIEIVRNGGK